MLGGMIGKDPVDEQHGAFQADELDDGHHNSRSEKDPSPIIGNETFVKRNRQDGQKQQANQDLEHHGPRVVLGVVGKAFLAHNS